MTEKTVDPLANFHAGRIGKTRTGKTLGLIIDANKFQRVIIYDTNKDFIRTQREPITTRSGKEISLAHNFKIVEGGPRELVRAINEGYWQICYLPPSSEDLSDFNSVAELVYQIALWLKWNRNLDLKFVVDEIWHFANRNVIQATLKTILREGLKENLSLRWSAQRMADTHTDVVTQCAFIDVFDVWGKDIEYLHKLIPAIDEALIEQLGAFEFYRFDTQTKSIVRYGRLD